jgi:hypothetical protein
MKDFLHQDVVVGDMVAYNPPTYKGMVIGRVKKLTPKGVTCIHQDWRGYNVECNRRIEEVLRVTQQYSNAKMENPELFI